MKKWGVYLRILDLQWWIMFCGDVWDLDSPFSLCSTGKHEFKAITFPLIITFIFLFFLFPLFIFLFFLFAVSKYKPSDTHTHAPKLNYISLFLFMSLSLSCLFVDFIPQQLQVSIVNFAGCFHSNPCWNFESSPLPHLLISWRSCKKIKPFLVIV